MADFAKHLPLSQRSAGDESGVSGDWRAAIATLIDQATQIISGTFVGAAAAPDPAVVDEYRAGLARGFLADAALRGVEDDLARAAGTVRSGRRRRIRELTRTLRALLVLADAVGAPARVAPEVTGPVALYAATSWASFDRRAVVRGHTVRATDQDWAFGRGPVLEASAEGVVRFLLALSDEPPRRPATTQTPPATVEE
jgi:hypothetical protein